MIQPHPIAPAAPATPEPAEQTIPVLGAGLDFSDPHSPLAPYYLRNGPVALVGLLGLFFFFLSFVPLWHTDVWGHLKFGEWMVQHGQLAADGLSPFAEPQPPGLHAYWLCQSGMYVVYHGGELLAGGDALHRMEGGVQALRTLHLLVLAARFVVLLLALRRMSKSLAVANLGLLFIVLLASGHIAIFRPQTFAELFFACVLLGLSRDVLSRRALLWMPLLLAVWANCHGSYLVGLVLIGVWLVGRVVSVYFAACTLRPTAVLADLQVRRLFLVLVLATAAVALLNPHGPYVFWNTLQMGANPNVASMDEWQPIDVTKLGPASGIFFASLTVLIVSQLVSKKFLSPAALLLLALFAVESVVHQRMLIWWLMLVPWILAPLWGNIAERFPRLWPFPASAPSFRKTILAFLLGAVIALWSAPGQWLVNGRAAPLDKSLSRGTPWQLAEQLRKPDDPAAAYLPELTETLAAYGPERRFRGRIFASETLGDYLLWTQPAETPVLVYSHVHLFSQEHWQDCLTVKWSRGWSKPLDRYGVNLIVVEADLHPNLREWLLRDPEWKVVLDESGSPDKPDVRTRLFVAVRKKPI